jgi:titin
LKQLKFDDGRFGSGSGANADTYCTDASTALVGGVDPKAAPVVSTTIKQAVTVGGGSTGTPTATTTSATPTATQTSATPTATQTSATPTATSATPTATPTSATPTATPTATGVASTLTCSTLGQNQPWSATWSASVTGTKVNVAFDKGPANGPVPLQSGWLKATAEINAPSKVAVEGTPYGALAAREIIPGTTLTGTVSGTPTSITVTKVVFKDIGSGSSVDTTCMPNAVITVPVASSPALPDTLPTATGDLTVNPDMVTAGGKVTLSGEGFAPGSNATAGMYSTPVTLGVGTANAQGVMSVDVTIPSGTTGSHTLILLGSDNSGGVVALTKTITVIASTSTPTPTPTDTSTTDPTDDPDNPGTLPQTGPGDFTMTLVWALVALQIGLIVAVRASRSRRPATAAGKHRR